MTARVLSELYYDNESFFLATVALSAKGPDWMILIPSLTVLFVILVILVIAWSFRRKRRQKKGNTCIITCQFLFKINGWQEKNFVQLGCSIYFRIQFCRQNYLEDIKWSLTCKGTFNQVSKLIQDCVVLFRYVHYSNIKWAMHKTIQSIWTVYRCPFLLVSHCDCFSFAFKTLRWTALV